MKAPGFLKTTVAPGQPTLFEVWLRYVMVAAMYVFLASIYVSIAVASIALGVMALCFGGIMISERQFLVHPTPLDYFFLAYAAAELLSTIFSVRPMQSLDSSRRILFIGIVYFFATWITTDQAAKRAVAVLLSSAGIVACIGVGKLAFNPAEEVVRLGIFQSYITTSELMMPVLLLLFPFAIHPGTPRRIRAVVIIGLLPAAISLYATAMPMACAAALVGLALTALLRNKLLIILLAMVVLLVMLFAPPFAADPAGDIASLTTLWDAGLKLFAKHPVFGVGEIDLRDLLLPYMSPGAALHGDMRNIAMQFLVSLGSVGFIAVAALFGRMAQIEWRIWKRVGADWFRGSVALGALAVFVGFLVDGLADWSFAIQEVTILLWTTLGLSLAVGELPPLKAPAGESAIPSGERGER